MARYFLLFLFKFRANKWNNVRKRTFGHMRPAKIQISLRIRAVWSESPLGAYWIAKDAKFLHADNEDSARHVGVVTCIWRLIRVPTVSHYSRGGSRGLLRGHDLIILPYLLYVFGQTGLSKHCRLRSDAAKGGVWSGLYGLLPIQQFSTHSQVVKWTC